MAALYFCACFILTLAEFLVVADLPVYVLKGDEVALSPILSDEPADILWKHNGDKVISFDLAEEHVFPQYDGRVTLGWTTAELTIAAVGYEDSGEYELDALIRGRLHRSQYMLKVLDTVSKPVIRCEVSDDSSNSTVRRATLLCSSDSDTPETLTFKWNLEGKSHLGQSLSIPLGNKDDHTEYSCTATNPLQTETSVFMVKDCNTAERRSEALDVIVPIVIASLILLAFCLFPFIFRHQIKRACLNQRKNKDVEKQITETDDNGKDEGSPLMGDIHRQETFASKQPLIQQNDVTVAPPKQESETDMDEMQTSEPAPPVGSGQVDSDRVTDSYQGHESERGGDAESCDSGPEHPEPQSPSLSSDSKDLLSKPPEHESDLDNSNHEAVPNTKTAGDSSSIHSDQEDTTKAPEEKNSLPPPPLQMNEFGSDQDSESEPVEPESREQTDPDDKSTSELKDPPTDVSENKSVHSEHTATRELGLSNDSPASLLLSKQPESPPPSPASVQDKEETSPETKSDPEHKDLQTDSDHESVSSSNSNENAEDAPLSDVQQKPPNETSGDSASSQSDQTESQDSGANAEESNSITEENPPEQDSPSEESKHSEQISATEKMSTDRPGSPCQPPHQNNVPVSDQDSELDTVKSGSTEQTDPEDAPTSASELKDQLTDVPLNESVTSEPKPTGESELSSDSQTSPPRSEQPESPPPSPLQSSPASDQEDKQQTSPETKSDPEHKDLQTDSDHESVSSSNSNENAEDAPLSDVQQKPPDSETPGDSASSQSDQTESQDSGANVEESNSITEENPPEQDSPSEEFNDSEQTSATEKIFTDRPDSSPQPPHQNNVPVSEQDSEPETVKSGSAEQTDRDDAPTSASELKDPPTDVPQNESVTSELKPTGESELSDDSQTSPPRSEQPESPPPSPLQKSPASDQEDKQQTSPETKSDSEHNHPLTDSDHKSVSSDSHDENGGDVAQTEKPDTDHSGSTSGSSETDQKENQDPVTNAEDSTSDKEPHKQDSPSEESEESKLASATETTSTEMPGSVKEAAESNYKPQL